jgi:hypothetical protein
MVGQGATGQRRDPHRGPSGLIMLDVDAGEDPGALRKRELVVGRAPETLRASTGGVGEHLFFRYPATKPGKEAREARNSQGLLGPGRQVPGRLRLCSAEPEVGPLRVDPTFAPCVRGVATGVH